MPDLDLAKLREQIAREIDPHAMQSHEQWLEQARAAALDLGASPDHPEIIRLARDNFVSMEGRREQARAKADAILSLLRPALQAAWEAGREACADHINRTWWDLIEARRIAEDFRALTPPDYPAALIAQAEAGAEESA